MRRSSGPRALRPGRFDRRVTLDMPDKRKTGNTYNTRQRENLQMGLLGRLPTEP